MSSDPGPTAASTDRLGEAVERYQAAVDDFDRELARLLGVNETDLRCLEILIREAAEPVTPRLLADRLGLTTGSVTAMLDRLERIGYLTRSAHPTDKRRLIVRATDTVRSRAFELLAPLLEEGNQLVTNRYGAAELELIRDFLTRTTELQAAHTLRLRDLAPYPRE
jgi:DNA-binding MarR family transcriptional regulator